MWVQKILSPTLMALLLLGCDGQKKVTETPPMPAGTATIKVALIIKALTNPFFVELEKGAKRAQQENSIDLIIHHTDEETAIEQQIQLVEDAVHEHVDGVVITPVDSKRLVPVLKKAQDAGIKIINIDNRLDAASMREKGMAPVPFISINNEQAAYLSAKYLADRVKKPDGAMILEGIRQAANARDRKHGAERAFSENPNIQLVVEETADWNFDEAYAAAKRIFPQHASIHSVFCANDMMALGVIKYLKEENRHDVHLAAFDALDEAKVAIKAGYLSATVDQQAALQGYQGVLAAVKAIRNEKIPSEIQLDAALVTAETLKQH